MSQQRTAVSHQFFPSIPRRWEIAELLRVSKALNDLKDKEEHPHERVERSVVALMEQNQEVPRQSIYGLTAVALQRVGLLESARTIACTLRERKPQQFFRSPGTQWKLDYFEVLASNHRYFQLPGFRVDPIYVFYQKLGKQVECVQLQQTSSYPIGIAAGLLAQFVDSKADNKRRKNDKTQNWFNIVVHRLARRQLLTADALVPGNGNADRKIRIAIRRRQGFEGMLRMMIPRFAEESKDHWEHHLANAIRFEFPNLDEKTTQNLVARVKDPNIVWTPSSIDFSFNRRKIKMVEPEIGDSGNTTR